MIVRQQADTGIDIVSDGEFSKGRNWAFYIFKRITGIAIRPATPEELNDPLASMTGGQDRKAFAEFYDEYDIANGLAKRLGNRSRRQWTDHLFRYASEARHCEPEGRRRQS